MQAGERREQLLDATKTIVAERGFHAVSIEAVAREAGITRPIVYGHFNDLPGLLEALVERETARALGQLVTVLPPTSRATRARRSWPRLRGYLEAVRDRPGHLAARADAARGRAGDPPRPIARAAPRSSSSSRRRSAPASAGRESPDPELFARTSCRRSPTRARACC